MLLPRVCVLAACVAVSTVAAAQDSALGTFTVNGRTVRFTRVYATIERAPADPGQQYLMILVSDVALAEPDRVPDRLAVLAQSGQVHAIRLRWRSGTDDVTVVPYHREIAESGRAFRSLSTVNLSVLSDTRVQAEFRAKMLGQTWFFNAIVKSGIARGGVATLEADAAPADRDRSLSGEAGDSAAPKLALGRLGYAFTPEAFFQAIGDSRADAVALFLRAGMTPNQRNGQNRYALNHAVLFCARSPEESASVIEALVAGKADLRTRDPDNGTTALVGSIQSCTPRAVETLIKAGSDLSAKSNGGTTALQLARIFQRQDVAVLLERAGAR